jgi:hypothetical protein
MENAFFTPTLIAVVFLLLFSVALLYAVLRCPKTPHSRTKNYTGGGQTNDAEPRAEND